MERPHKLEQWVRYLSEVEMPVLATTARAIAGISDNVDTSVTDLAQVVLADSSMTARVLRMANSVYYNPSGKTISTVSRAIVMLGFDAVRAIALSIAMVDTFLRGRQHERVTAEMAVSFHAAIQAKAIATYCRDASPEEVFIATLLNRLGHMAFWCFPNGYDDELEQAISVLGDEKIAEREVLTFNLVNLTQALNEEWHLSPLLGRSFSEQGKKEKRTQPLLQAIKLAQAALEGWSSGPARSVIADIAEHTGQSFEDAELMVHENARHAAKTAAEYGAINASRHIPLPKRTIAEVDEERAEASKPVAIDFELQVEILRELSSMLAERADLNSVVGMVLEGIYRAVGMDRAILALVSGDGSYLTAKYALGEDREQILSCFNFPVGHGKDHIIAQALRGTDALWLGKQSRNWRQFHTPPVSDCIGEVDFFGMPIIGKGKAAGLIYADRGLTGRPLDERSFDGFKHFAQQAMIGIAVLGVR